MKTPLSLLIMVFAAIGQPARAQTAPPPAEGAPSTATPAKLAFGEGVRLFNEEDFVGATAAFERAYKLRPHYYVQCNIARSYEQRAEAIKAARHYRRCLDEGAKQSASAAEVRASLRRMERQIAWILVRSPRRAGELVVDGRRRGATPGRVAVNPGAHVVEVRWRGASSVSRSVSLRGGERRRLVLNPTGAVSSRVTPSSLVKRMKRPPRRRGISQWWFWSGVVVTAALTATAIAQSVETLRRAETYQESPDPHNYDRAKQTRLLANIFWGGAIAAAGTTTTLFFFTDFNTRQRERRVAVYGLGLRGSF